MTISTQWMALGAIAVALFVTGMFWPKTDNCTAEEREEHSGADHQSRPHRRSGEAAALSGAGR